jgi:hypothetical protein
MPAEDTVGPAGLKDADARGVGAAELHDQLRAFLKNAARTAGHFFGQRGEGAIFGGMIRRARWTMRQL